MRILIVEDEVRLAATLQDLMELNGYTADICHDGVSGLDEALTGIYDVIVLDVMLPKLDGFTVLRRLRAAGITTPVLMLTARSEVTDKVTGLDGGAIYTLADNATGVAAHTDGRYYVTQTSALHFLRNQSVGTVRATACVRHRGKSTVLTAVDITGEGGKLLATGEFTFFCVDKALMDSKVTQE